MEETAKVVIALLTEIRDLNRETLDLLKATEAEEDSEYESDEESSGSEELSSQEDEKIQKKRKSEESARRIMSNFLHTAKKVKEGEVLTQKPVLEEEKK